MQLVVFFVIMQFLAKWYLLTANHGIFAGNLFKGTCLAMVRDITSRKPFIAPIVRAGNHKLGACLEVAGCDVTVFRLLTAVRTLVAAIRASLFEVCCEVFAKYLDKCGPICALVWAGKKGVVTCVLVIFQ